MNEYDKDVLSQKILVNFPFGPLLSTPRNLYRSDKKNLGDLCNRVDSVDFDYVPNWGINGLRENISGLKDQNWYRSSPFFREKATRRFSMINHQRLKPILQEAVQDIAQSKEELLGYCLYGSYLYGYWKEFDDIDILIIVRHSSNLALDALRYRHADLRNIFRSIPETIERPGVIGLTIISQDTLTINNQSRIVTEAALVDVATGVSVGQCVSAPLLTPFVILKNAQKLIGWGGANVLKAPKKALGLIDQVIRQRNWMIAQYKEISFKETFLNQFLFPVLKHNIGNKNYMLEICYKVQKQLREDERFLRDAVIRELVSNR